MSQEIDVDAQFYYMNNLGEMAYPLLMAKNIKANLINYNELEEFQRYFIKLYPNLKQFIKPSEEKDIYVPYNILAKYYLHLYTHESDFFKNLNIELSKGKFDRYRQYIFILYIALNKGYFRSCIIVNYIGVDFYLKKNIKFCKIILIILQIIKKFCFFPKNFYLFLKAKK